MSGYSPRYRRAVTTLVVAFSLCPIAFLPAAAAAPEPVPAAPSVSGVAKPERKPEPIIFYAAKYATTQPSDLKVGDSWVSYLSLFDEKKRRAGDASVQCSAVHVGTRRSLAQCTRVLRTERGLITLIGLETVPAAVPVTSLAAVTGGTGHYTGLTGTVRVTDGPRHVAFRVQPAG